MKALRVALVSIAAVLAVLPAAWAADLGGAPVRKGMKDAPYVVPSAFSWSGFYVGTHLGYGWSDIDWEGVSPSLSGSGALAGGQIGYNWQRGALVLGVEADASTTWMDGSGAGCCGHSINWMNSVRGRAGAAINSNRTLLYATAGVAWADLDYSAAGFNGFSETHFGLVAGGGIEHMLTHNLSARVEYLYYGFNDATAPAGSLGAGATSVDPSMQTVRFGLNFKF